MITKFHTPIEVVHLLRRTALFVLFPCQPGKGIHNGSPQPDFLIVESFTYDTPLRPQTNGAKFPLVSQRNGYRRANSRRCGCVNDNRARGFSANILIAMRRLGPCTYQCDLLWYAGKSSIGRKKKFQYFQLKRISMYNGQERLG